ncbi:MULTISPECIES: cupin domain-containing protein [Xanthomonas]|uniref:Cupin domain-containing protein n=1 Tax=Xanthomonas hydrangeae TaxID=2775159 RepID=A0AAU0BB20_9XANT|nr:MULTISPECIES: cupin domain-containing protein [Xanthomonas]MCM5622398.1 cupin domain-containing protein [Xanthomonas hortorum pv. pelargonii]MCM5630725.1 cupin domain-containing protein [Xanthomonas hortorum pv. pelargonii]MCU1703809.1 cupin domain-containing protein [Xanthomonas hortorum pv. pelargonii]MCU1707805.1 cupin domain-containing protein [Xanthomonas hortorum pv. pelargonii]MDC8651878.1 cupin domain-containing protein [Xanthomonas hortorum pv. pelargonii]
MLRASESALAAQGVHYAMGISAQSTGATGLSLHVVTIAPGARAKPHLHASHETAIYALTGVSKVWHGAALEHHDVVQPGDFLYIPAGMPHQPYNDGVEAAVVLVARTDPNTHESVVLLPELDGLHG